MNIIISNLTASVPSMRFGGIKPLPEPMLIYHPLFYVTFPKIQIQAKCLWITEMCWKIIHLIYS